MLQKFILLFFILVPAGMTQANGFYNAPLLVKSAQVEFVELYDTYSSIGQYKSDRSRDFYANVTGKLELLSAKQGDKVHKGDILLVIDKEIASSTKAQALSVLKTDETSYKRHKALFEKKFISSGVLEKARVDFENAKLQCSQAIKTYNDMFITAPFDGIMGVIKARVGDNIEKGDYLFSIIEGSSALTTSSIFIELPETLYGKVSNATEVIITDSNKNKAHGKIAFISQYLSDTGFLSAKIIVNNDSDIIHGSYVNCELIINKHNNLAIPEQAIQRNNQGSFVYKIGDDNIIKRIYVTLGTRTNNLIEIISPDIKTGDLVVLEGLTKVDDGSSVKVVE